MKLALQSGPECQKPGELTVSGLRGLAFRVLGFRVNPKAEMSTQAELPAEQAGNLLLVRVGPWDRDFVITPR